MKAQIRKTIAAIAAFAMAGTALPFAPAVYAESSAPMKAEAPRQHSPECSGRLTISEPGVYLLRGKMTGTLYINAGDNDVKLLLDNVLLDGGSRSAIIQTGGNLEISAKPGTENVIMGSGTAIMSDGNIKITGGSFSVISDGCAFGAAELTAEDCSVSVTAESIAAEGTIITDNSGCLVLNGDAEQETAVFVPETYYTYVPQNTDTSPEVPQGQPGEMNGEQTLPEMPQGQPGEMNGEQTPPEMPQGQPGEMNGEQTPPEMPQGQTAAVSTVDEPSGIVSGITENSAMSLTADYENALRYTLDNEDGDLTISSAGTYIVTGQTSNGGITVKKGTTGVILVLEDLDLTSTSGAALSVNKNAEVQIIVSGKVTLTDNENPDDENSEDEEVADAYDGAAVKVKAGSVVFIAGDGELDINGNAKNGIKGGEDSSIIIGGDVTVNISAVNDGINGGYDVTILDGTLNINAGDDAVHADHILSIGSSGEGPDITITDCEEGLEGTVVNIAGGNISVKSKDDAVNAANSDGTYSGELDYSINMTGGSVTIDAGGDGFDSNGHINLIGGYAKISSAYNGGEAGIDYDGGFYISDSFILDSNSGVAGPDNMMPGGAPGGTPGGMPGGMNRPF